MNINQQQKRLLFAIGSGIVLVCGLASLFFFSGDKSKPQHTTVPAYKIQTPGDTVHSNEVWMQKVDQETQLQSKKIQALEALLEKQALRPKVEEKPDELIALRQEVDMLKQTLNRKAEDISLMEQEGTGVNQSSKPSSLIKHVLRLQQTSYRLNKYVPSGAYAKAVLMSAVDASVGVNVSSDPQPVLLRLLGDGHLPNEQHSRLKRCMITGAARGDISSERVFIRLEKMSCVDTRTHSIVETDVSGYIVGEDGKNGLAGVVVDRSGRVLSGAVLSGILSGASSMLQSWVANRANALTTPRPDLIQNNVMGGEFLKGGAQSMGNAFDKLADYYIKRAEQLQPVVQLNAGRVVHVVFSKGATIGTQQSSVSQTNQNQESV